MADIFDLGMAQATRLRPYRAHRAVPNVTGNGLVKGEVTYVFPQPFARKPVVVCGFEHPTSTQPFGYVIKACSASQVTITVFAARTLPGLTAGMLVGGLITALTGFNVFGGTNFAGLILHIEAGLPTEDDA